MKKILLITSIIMSNILLLSCSSPDQSISYASPNSSYAYNYQSQNTNMQNETSIRLDAVDVSNPINVRKVLFSATLSLTVDNPDTVNNHIKAITEKYNGYINEISTRITIIRVKKENFINAINEISLLGDIQNKYIYGQDVTDEFLDDQIRLDNAQKARDRYLQLLAKAENVAAALLVEKELERLNSTIDMIKGRMSRINQLSEFSTITIVFEEKKNPGILGYIGLGLYYSVKWLFVRN